MSCRNSQVVSHKTRILWSSL